MNVVDTLKEWGIADSWIEYNGSRYALNPTDKIQMTLREETWVSSVRSVTELRVKLETLRINVFKTTIPDTLRYLADTYEELSSHGKVHIEGNLAHAEMIVYMDIAPYNIPTLDLIRTLLKLRCVKKIIAQDMARVISRN